MKKKNKEPYVGVYGSRVKIQPDKPELMLVSDDPNLIQKGTVIGAGEYSNLRVGQKIIFNSWGVDKIGQGDEASYYVLDTDEFILEVLS